MLLPLLFALQVATIYADPGDAPPVPDAAQHAYGAYLACLMEGPLDPFEQAALPADPAARTALVEQALSGCHAQRVASVAEMEAKFPRSGAFADPSKRHARIEEIIGKAEQRISFAVISREEFQAMTRKMLACLNQGSGDRCTPATPIK